MLRLRHGYKEARAAGITRFGQPSVAKTNLEAFLRRHPRLCARVSRMVKLGCHADAILNELRAEGLDGRFALELWRDAKQKILARTEYSDDRQRLEEQAEFGLSKGVYGTALLWKYNKKSKDWEFICQWPEEEDAS